MGGIALFILGVAFASLGCGGGMREADDPRALAFVQGSRGETGSMNDGVAFTPRGKYLVEVAGSTGGGVPFWGPHEVHVLSEMGTEVATFGDLEKDCRVDLFYSTMDTYVSLVYSGYQCEERSEIWTLTGERMSRIPGKQCRVFSPNEQLVLCHDTDGGWTGLAHVISIDGSTVSTVASVVWGDIRLDDDGHVTTTYLDPTDGVIVEEADGVTLHETPLQIDTDGLLMMSMLKGEDTFSFCCHLDRSENLFGAKYSSYMYDMMQDPEISSVLGSPLAAEMGIEVDTEPMEMQVMDTASFIGVDGSATVVNTMDEIESALENPGDMKFCNWLVSPGGDFVLWDTGDEKWQVRIHDASGDVVGAFGHDTLRRPDGKGGFETFSPGEGYTLRRAGFVGGRSYVFTALEHDALDYYSDEDVWIWTLDGVAVGRVDPEVIAQNPTFSPDGERMIISVGPFLKKFSKVSQYHESSEADRKWKWVPQLLETFLPKRSEELSSNLDGAFEAMVQGASGPSGEGPATGRFVLEDVTLVHDAVGPESIPIVAMPFLMTLVHEQGVVLLEAAGMGFADGANHPRDWIDAQGHVSGNVVRFDGFHLQGPGYEADEAAAFVESTGQDRISITVQRKGPLGDIVRYTFRRLSFQELVELEQDDSEDVFSTPDPLAPLLDKVAGAVEDGDAELAFQLLDEARQESPGDARIFTLLGTLHASQGHVDESVEFLRMAIFAGAGKTARDLLALVQGTYLQTIVDALPAVDSEGEVGQEVGQAIDAFLESQQAGDADALGEMLAQADLALLAGYPDTQGAALYIQGVKTFLASDVMKDQLRHATAVSIHAEGDLASARIMNPLGVDEQMVLVKKDGQWKVLRFLLPLAPGEEVTP